MNISVILPVMNETFSLEETVDILLKENPGDIFEIIIVTASRTIPESLHTIERLVLQYPNLIRPIRQQLPFLGGAIRDAFTHVRGDYTLMMASDLETDPHTVRAMILKAKEGVDIVACTRWHDRGGFKGYNPLKLILNKLFQSMFKLLYRTILTDLTFGFRLYKTPIIQRLRWEELKHPFLFESIIKPLRLGYTVVEIPTSWHARSEGESQNTFFQNFHYFITGLRVLVTPKKRLLV